MSAIAVVAGGRDAQFAEQVRAGLQAAGREAALQQQLPVDSSARVILIWSAGLESAHAIDAKTLIGLWSEDRLTVVRRDNTPLPLGLRDLPSLNADATAEAVCATALGTSPAASKPRSHLLTGLGVLASVVLVLAGSWYYVTAEQRAKQAELTARLEAASKASEDLNKAKQAEVEAQKKLAEARVAGLEAIKRGDTAKAKELEEARKKAESEAAKQSEAVKQREAAAQKARDDGKKAQEAAKQAKAEPRKQEVAAAAPKEEAPKAEAPAPKAAAYPAAPSKSAPMSRSERERIADEEAARKALAKAGRPHAGQETAVASAASSPTTSEGAAAESRTPTDHEALYQQALAMENGGDAKGAIRIYRRAARAGSGKAAKRLGEIYDRGVPGVSRDYAESLQWYETARQLGEAIETASARGGPMESAPLPAVRPEQNQVPNSQPAVPPAEPEAAKAEAPAPAPKAAPKISAPAPTPEALKAATKAAAPEPVPAPAAVPLPAAAPSAEMEMRGPMHERRPFNWRYLLIGALVLAAIFWRRAVKRRRRAERAASQSDVASRPAMTAAAPSAMDGATLFVSYSHKDRSRVEPIVSVIEEMGRRVWMDRTDITGQAGWAGQIVRAIRECRAVVLMASPNSYSSDQVVRELYLAMNHKKAIVPIEIEPAEMPDELQYILAPYQHHRLSGGEARAVLGRALAAI